MCHLGVSLLYGASRQLLTADSSEPSCHAELATLPALSDLPPPLHCTLPQEPTTLATTIVSGTCACAEQGLRWCLEHAAQRPRPHMPAEHCLPLLVTPCLHCAGGDSNIGYNK